MTTKRAAILFMTADPSNASRLRLGRELRDIEIRLQLSGAGEHLALYHRASVRPGDLTQAIFDTTPTIVHFSGHGMSSGELLLENDAGAAHPVAPEALKALFALYRDKVRCVFLNACYSEAQAQAISKHVEFVVGMRNAIGDEAAVAFAVGFYKALAAGRPIPECFEFGLVELRLHNIPEHDTPVLLERDSPVLLFLRNSYVRGLDQGTMYSFPAGYSRHAKFLCGHPELAGCLLVDLDAYMCIGHLLDDIYTNHLRNVVAPFSYGTEWLLRLSDRGFGPRLLLAPWEWVLRPDDQQLQDLPGWRSERTPASFGLSHQTKGDIVFSDGIPRLVDCAVVATNNALVCDIIHAGLKPTLMLLGCLSDTSVDDFHAEDFRYKLVMLPIRSTWNKRVLIDPGPDLPELFGPEELRYWLRRDE